MSPTNAIRWGWRLSTKPLDPPAVIRQFLQAGIATVFLWGRSSAQIVTLVALGALATLPRAAMVAARASIDPATPLTSTSISYAARFWVLVGRTEGQIVRSQVGFVAAVIAGAALGRLSVLAAALFPAGLVLCTVGGCAAGILIVRGWFASRALGAIAATTLVSAVGGLVVGLSVVLAAVAVALYGGVVAVGTSSLAGRWAEEIGVLSAERGRRPWEPPPLRRSVRALSRRESLAAALLWKGVLSRFRAPTTPLRLGVIFAIAVGYGTAARAGMDFFLLDHLAALGVVLAAGVIVDGAPSPLGAEGARLSLLLTAPISRGHLLMAKTISHFVPCVGIALTGTAVAALVAGRLSDLPAASLVVSAFAVVVVGLATVVSVFDTNLNAYPSSPAEAIWLEEVPATAARAVAFHLIAALTAGAVFTLTAG